MWAGLGYYRRARFLLEVRFLFNCGLFNFLVNSLILTLEKKVKICENYEILEIKKEVFTSVAQHRQCHGLDTVGELKSNLRTKR